MGNTIHLRLILPLLRRYHVTIVACLYIKQTIVRLLLKANRSYPAYLEASVTFPGLAVDRPFLAKG